VILQELLALFRAIDASEEAAVRVSAAVAASAERLEMLQRAAESRIGSSGGFAKLTSWLSSKSAMSRSSSDAPIMLPPWVPSTALINADTEVARIASALASCGAPLIASSSRSEKPLQAEEKEGEFVDSVRSEVFPPDNAMPLSSTAAESNTETDAIVAGAATASLQSVGRPAALAAGEDDEDDDDSDSDGES
jgi:hypothetical protein